MRGLIKQLRVSLLVTLGLSVFDLSHEVLRATRSGNYLAAVGDWAVWTAVICLCVAVVHAVIYGAVHTGRPGSGEARGSGSACWFCRCSASCSHGRCGPGSPTGPTPQVRRRSLRPYPFW